VVTLDIFRCRQILKGIDLHGCDLAIRDEENEIVSLTRAGYCHCEQIFFGKEVFLVNVNLLI
jgi:hypothetical protein